jgi:hypothetical protein
MGKGLRFACGRTVRDAFYLMRRLCQLASERKSPRGDSNSPPARAVRIDIASGELKLHLHSPAIADYPAAS